MAPCPPGSAGTPCELCAAGTYSDSYSASSCTGLCPAGTFAAAGSRTIADCKLCAPGTHDHDDDASTKCLLCPAGKSGAGGDADCVDCAAGTTSVGGSAQCAAPSPTLVETYCGVQWAACQAEDGCVEAVLATIAAPVDVGTPLVGATGAAVLECMARQSTQPGYFGCTDPSATNYNPSSFALDETCEYDCETLWGAEDLPAGTRCVSFDEELWQMAGTGGEPQLDTPADNAVVQGRPFEVTRRRLDWADMVDVTTAATATLGPGVSSDAEAARIIDGLIDLDNSPSGTSSSCDSPLYVTVDLGQEEEVGAVLLIHEHDGTGSRQHCGQKVAVSTTGEFAGEEVVVYDTEMGVGPPETASGNTIVFDMTLARYVRHWCAADGSTVKFVEVGVRGALPEVATKTAIADWFPDLTYACTPPTNASSTSPAAVSFAMSQRRSAALP